jgi:hypothetical protein
MGIVLEYNFFPLYLVAAMFLGMDLPGLNLPNPQKTYVMIGFVAWHIGTEVVLEIHAYRLSKRGNLLGKPCDVASLLFYSSIFLFLLHHFYTDYWDLSFLVLVVDPYKASHY